MGIWDAAQANRLWPGCGSTQHTSNTGLFPHCRCCALHGRPGPTMPHMHPSPTTMHTGEAGRVAQQAHRAQQVVDQHGLEHVQLKVPAAAGHRHRSLVAHDLAGARQRQVSASPAQLKTTKLKCCPTSLFASLIETVLAQTFATTSLLHPMDMARERLEARRARRYQSPKNEAVVQQGPGGARRGAGAGPRSPGSRPW